MRKFLLWISLLCCFFLGTAQTPAKYQGELDLGYSVGVGTFSTGRVNLHTVQGVKIADYFSTGLGFGLDYYHEFYDKGELFIPIYLNMKGYIPVSDKFAPFISLDLGYGIGATAGVSGCGGVLWAPSVGMIYDNFKFQIGYTSQRMSEDGFGIDMNAAQFKIGLIF